MTAPISNRSLRPMRVLFHIPGAWQDQEELLFMDALAQLAHTYSAKLTYCEHSEIIALDDELPDDPHGTEAGLLDPAAAPSEVIMDEDFLVKALDLDADGIILTRDDDRAV